MDLPVLPRRRKPQRSAPVAHLARFLQGEEPLGEIELDDEERSGAATFVRKGSATWHLGPGFSDGEFHNVGIGSGRGADNVFRRLHRLPRAGELMYDAER